MGVLVRTCAQGVILGELCWVQLPLGAQTSDDCSSAKHAGCDEVRTLSAWCSSSSILASQIHS